MPVAPFLDSIVQFLRAGYPDGVPERDYIPLFALLARQLTTEEVDEVADALISKSAGADVSPIAVRDAIQQVTKEKPLEADIARVSANLAAGGWPLASARPLENMG